MPRALIFVNGEIPDRESARRLIEPGDKLIAVDGGLRHLDALDHFPGVVIGDMDSIDPAQAARLTLRGTRTLRFDPVKDETDLELALRYARAEHYDPILIVGALGGRIDQTLGNIALITAPAYCGTTSIDDGIQRITAITDHLALTGHAGDTISLIPWGAPVTGIVTGGLRYPLNNETLYPDHTRGISNELIAEHASINIASGILICAHARNV
jgi:thiamine pyrophosphokinase